MAALCRCSADLPLKTLKKDLGSSKQQANLATNGARRITSYGRHTENLAGTAPLNLRIPSAPIAPTIPCRKQLDLRKLAKQPPGPSSLRIDIEVTLCPRW